MAIPKPSGPEKITYRGRIIEVVEQPMKAGEKIPQMPFFPNYILRDVLAWYVAIAILAALLLAGCAAYSGGGLKPGEARLEDVLRVLGAKRWDVLVKVGLPRSMPYFYGSLKIAITLAFVGTVLAEMTAGDSGIGYLMLSAGSQQRMALAFAGLVVRAVYIQVIENDFFQRQGEVRFARTLALPAQERKHEHQDHADE